jgi:cysteine-rich repeat protein
VRIQINEAAGVSAMAPSLSIFTMTGRVFGDRPLTGKIPGDVVVLVDDDAGVVRALVHATDDSSAPLDAAGAVAIRRGAEVELTLTLSTPLADLDGDGVPDVIDDCPDVADPAQDGSCEVNPDGGPPGSCGDGTVQTGEGCDDGPRNNDDPASLAGCTSQCKKRAPCGSVAGAGGAHIDPSTGHCYVAWPTLVAWAAGERDCLSRGGHLAAITAQTEDDIVKGLTVDAPAWIGVVSSTGGVTTWSNGETGTYTDFVAGGQAMGAGSCVVSQPGSAGWSDRACSWPATGVLPMNTIDDAGYVCEHSCGNGVVEAGEECDPPTATTCTNACRTPRPCMQAGGMISPATGFCYFPVSGLVTYGSALTACPANTHLATPNAMMETETALKVITADSWIAVSAMTTAQAFQFDGPNAPMLSLKRYHGFVDVDPNQTTPPQCVAISYMHMGGDGWRDRTCDAMTTYPVVCERDAM